MNRVVYFFKDRTSNAIIYIGHGLPRRAREYSRNIRLDAWVKENGKPRVEIVASGLTKEAASTLAAEMIVKHDSPALLNSDYAADKGRVANAERQRRYRERQAEQGLVVLTLMVPAKSIAEFKRAAEMVADDRDLSVDCLRSAKTGRLRGLK